MKRMTRLVNPLRQSTASSGWKALATITIVAGLGFTTLAISSPANAQDRSDEIRRDRGGSFPTTQSMEEGVADEVKRGKLTQEQADMILRVHARLMAGIDSGKLSTGEALGIMEERSIAIYEGEQARSKDDANSRYDQAVAKMTERVKAGEITREQMQQRLEGMKKRLAGSNQSKMTKAEYDAASEKMIAMVKAGEITREQMQQRLDRMNKAMGKEKTFSREEYAKAAADMQKMVDAGKITEADMKTRLGEMRKMIRITRADYAKAQADMKKMVEEGEITEAQMNQRLDRMKKMIAKDQTFSREEYAKAQADMQKMVDEGKITEGQMKQRLDRMRKMIGKQGDAKSRGTLRDQYAGMQRRLEHAVKEGMMTQDEADERLKAFGTDLRKKAAENPKAGSREAKATYDQMKQRLNMAVESGRMTQEEADKRLQDFKNRTEGSGKKR